MARAPKEWKTVQNRFADKVLARLGVVTRFSLENSFRGETVADAADVLKKHLDWDTHIQVHTDGTKGRLHRHSNLWYEFTLTPEAK